MQKPTPRLFIILFILIYQNSFGQDETKIWSVAANAIYREQSHFVYNPNAALPIAPTAEVDTTSRVKANDPFIMRVLLSPEENTQGMAKIITTQMLKKNRTETKFYDSKQEHKTITLDTAKLSFCFEFDNQIEKIDLDTKKSCVLYPTVKISTKILTMSQIMYSKDNKMAVLWGNFVSKPLRREEEIWGMLLKKAGSSWEVIELVFEPRR